MSFVDCGGLRALCRARNRVLARGGRFRLVTESARLLGILRCVGLGDAVEVLSRLPESGVPAPRPGVVAVTVGQPVGG